VAGQDSPPVDHVARKQQNRPATLMPGTGPAEAQNTTDLERVAAMTDLERENVITDFLFGYMHVVAYGTGRVTGAWCRDVAGEGWVEARAAQQHGTAREMALTRRHPAGTTRCPSGMGTFASWGRPPASKASAATTPVMRSTAGRASA